MILRLRNRPEELLTVQRAVAAFGIVNRLSTKLGNELGLVVEELLVNVITHAFPDGGAHEIILSIERRGNDVEIICRDDGVPFDPLSVPPPDITLPTAERPIGGLGIHFIRSFSDNQLYRRESGENILTLRKRLTPRGAASKRE
jgi:anti-sigma regulatory factor (Ser/Thr protein kinase)